MKSVNEYLNEGKEMTGSYDNVKDLIKAVENLPDAIRSLEVPETLTTFQPSSVKFTIKDYSDNSWKKDAIEQIKKTLKLKGGKDVDEFHLSSYFGKGKINDPFYIQFSSKDSRQFADDMSSGKYGSLD